MFVIIHGGFIPVFYVSNTLQGMINLRKLVESELFIHLGGRLTSHVEVIERYSLKLSSGYVLQLEKNLFCS